MFVFLNAILNFVETVGRAHTTGWMSVVEYIFLENKVYGCALFSQIHYKTGSSRQVITTIDVLCLIITISK